MKVNFNNLMCRFECQEKGIWYPITTNGYVERSLVIPSRIDRYRIEVSLTCNLRCQYCVVHMNNVSQQNTIMSMETARSIVERYNKEVGDNGSIFIMGGEPLTNIPIVKFIIKKAKGTSILFTNALFLEKDLIDFFYKHNTYILTSLDGYDYFQNRKRFWPHIEKKFDRVTNNIKAAIDRGCKVGVSCLLHKDNINEAIKIADYFYRELHAKAMSFAYPHSTVNHTEESDFNFSDYTEQMKSLYLYSKSNKVYIDQIAKIISCIYYGYPAKVGCKAGTTQRTFYPDGKETICTKIDTLNSFNFEEYISELPYVNDDCAECIAKNICVGECPWDFAVAKLEGRKHERICAFRRELITYIVKDICKELSQAENLEEAKLIFDRTFAPMVKNL